MGPWQELFGRVQLRRRNAVALAVACATTGRLMNRAFAEVRSITIPFAPAAQSGVPAGFSVARTGQGAPAVWTAIADPSVAGGFVLAQTSVDQTDYRFPLAIYEPVSAGDADVSVRFKAVAGRVDRAGGIAIRLIDPDNYYVVRANALEDNVNFYRVVKGSRREIKGVSAKVTSDAWHRLSLKADGNQFTISFDGKILFAASDKTFTAAGKIGLWTKADSVTYFDALTIKVPA